MKTVLMTAGAAVLALSTAASAATLTINPGRMGEIPSGTINPNDVLQDGSLGLDYPLGGFFGSQITLDERSRVTFEFLGFEAGFENSFSVNGTEIFNSETYRQNTVLPSQIMPFPSYTSIFDAGTLNFAFNTSGGVSSGNTVPAGTAQNGSNPLNSPAGTSVGALSNFFASFGDDEQTSGNGLYLFFDDGGKVNDDDHDDFAVRLTVNAVPLPGAALPLLTALAGLGFAARRRKTAKKA